MKKRSPALYGLYLSLALILSYIESLIPLPFGIPGMKIGLGNLMVVVLMPLYSPLEALCLNILRILLSGFMFGNAFGIIYSLGGAILSFFCMWLVYRSGLFTLATTSIIGGITHNIGQLLVAKIALGGVSLIGYAPFLLCSGVAAGFLIGVAAMEISFRLPPFLKEGGRNVRLYRWNS